MPSRCIFFLSAFRAWSTLLSRTRTCTLAPWLLLGRVKAKAPKTGALSRGALAEKTLRVHSCRSDRAFLHGTPGLNRSSHRYIFEKRFRFLERARIRRPLHQP